MVQCGSGLRFLYEATHAIVPSDIHGQNLQSDLAIELCVMRQVNHTHSTRAELGADFIAADFGAGWNRQAVVGGVPLEVFRSITSQALIVVYLFLPRQRGSSHRISTEEVSFVILF